MSNFWKTAACLGVVVAGSMGSMAPAAAAEAPAVRAALRDHAQRQIAEALTRKSVRPVDAAVIEADARKIASSLKDEQIRSMAGGGEVDAMIAAATSGPRFMSEAALGNPRSDLLFVPVAPCRIIDTRLAGGALAPGVTRDFRVTGTDGFLAQGGKGGGCGIPLGAADPKAPAVVVNFVAVGPAGPGHLEAWEFGQPVPNASVINYANVPGLNIANGVVVPIAGVSSAARDLNIRANVNPTHVVADVTGYFTEFPIDQFRSTEKSINVVSEGGQVDLSSGACTEVNSCTITSTSAGQVIIRAWAQVRINHGTNVGGDRVAVGVKNENPTACTNNDQSINATDFEVPDSLAADPNIDTTLSHKRIYTQPAGARTYYINARMITGASSGDLIENSRMVCTFIPN